MGSDASITCAWCGAKYTTYQEKCHNCGGPLPHPPGEDAGPDPPPPPRQLPPGFVRRVRFSGNPTFIVGVVFLAFALIFGATFIPVGIFGDEIAFLPIGILMLLAFGGVGFGLARAGHRSAMATLRAFEHGVAARGTIISVDYDTSIKVNNRSPWVVWYTFQALNREIEGKVQTFDYHAQQRQPGQPLHVLFVLENPEQNTIYPPFK